MAAQDRFIDNLANFTNALENLVELLKEQNRNNPTDVVNQLLEAIDPTAISKIVEQLEEIKEETKKTNNQISEVLSRLDGIRSQRETGMFGQVEDKKSKNTIVDGVKTIILIAAGVLAIGLAFKIVGRVDFFSVIGLGLAMVAVAYAFAEIAKIKDLSLKKALLVSGVMVILAGALVLSGALLKFMPKLSLWAMVSVVFVSIAMGIATVAMFMAAKHITLKDVGKIYMLPLLLPAIATALLGSALILKAMPIISFRAMLSAVMVGIAMVPATFAMALLIKALKGESNEEVTDPLTGKVTKKKTSALDLKSVGLALLVMPVIAASLVLTGLVLQAMPSVTLMKLLSAIGVGIAMIPAAIAVALLVKIARGQSEIETPGFNGLPGKKEKGSAFTAADVAKAAILMPLIAMTIVMTAWVFKLMPKKLDELAIIGGSLAISIAILPFAALIVGMTKLKLDYKDVLKQSGNILLIAGAIVATSWILSVGNYDKAPPLDWTLSTGLALTSFGLAMVLLNKVTNTKDLLMGALAMFIVAGTIVITSLILGLGSYENYPTLDWSLGVGLSMTTFGIGMIMLGAVATLGFGLGFLMLFAGAAAMLIVASTIVEVADILNGGNYDKFPTLDWSQGVGTSIMTFINAMDSVMSLGSFLGLFGGIDTDQFISFIDVVTDAILAAGQKFSGTNAFASGYPTPEWAGGVGGSVMMFANALLAISEIDTGFLGLGDMDADDFSAAIATISAGIVEAGRIFGKSNGVFGGNYPTKEWADGVGGSVAAFAQAIMALDDVDSDLWEDEGAFAAVTRRISEGIIAAGDVFNKNNIPFGGLYPSKEWSDNVGGTISTFAKSIAALDDVDSDLWEDDGDFAEAMTNISMGIIAVAKTLNGVDFGTYPDEGWVNGVSTSMNSIVNVMKNIEKLDDIDDSIEALEDITDTYRMFNNFMIEMSVNSNMYSSGGILENMGNSMKTLTTNLPQKGQGEGLKELISLLNDLSGSIDSDIPDTLMELAVSIYALSQAMNSMDLSKLSGLSTLSSGLHLMSLIDTDKLAEVLDDIDDKKSELISVADSGIMSGIFEQAKKALAGTELNVATSTESKSGAVAPDKYDTMIKHLRNIDTNIEKMANDVKTKEELAKNLESENVENKSFMDFFNK